MHSKGFTVAELLVVVIIVALLTTLAFPDVRSTDPEKLDLAAAQVAEAIRFARSEAIRSGEVHSVRIRFAQDEVSVGKADLSVEPVVINPVAYHPVTRQPYIWVIKDYPATAGVEISGGDPFTYQGLGTGRRQLLFDANGTPLYLKPLSGESYHLATATIRLRLDGRERVVRVAPYTGRVYVE